MSKRELYTSRSFFGSGFWASLVAGVTLFLFAILSFTPPASLSALDPVERTPSVAAPHPDFTDETFIRGVYHQHNERSRQIIGLDDTLGAGVCPLDANLDGWIDLFFVGGGGTHRYYGKDSWWVESPGNRLYLNDGRGYFSPAPAENGLQAPVSGMGCGTADLDNDGDHDIVLTAFDGVYLYENIGGGKFQRSRLSTQTYWSTGVAFSDVNNDGLLDIYVTNFIDYSHHARKYEGFSGHLVQQDNNFDSRAFTPRPNFLYINRGNLKFTDQATGYGVVNRDGRSVFATFYDLDKDGRDDLLVGNKEGSRSKTYLRRGEGFSDQTTSTDFPFPKNFHDFTAADLTGDGEMELIFTGPAGQPLAIFQRHETGYRDISSIYVENPTALYASEKFAVTALDVNGDRRTDLAITGGYPTPDLDSPATALGQRDLYLVNNPDSPGSVTSVEHALPKSGRTLLALDLDNDGDLDLVVTNNNDFPTLLINNSTIPGSEISSAVTRDSGYLGSYHFSTDFVPAAPESETEHLTYPEFLGQTLLDESQVSLRQLDRSFSQWEQEQQLRALGRISKLQRQDLRFALLQHGISGDPDIALYSTQIIIDRGIPGFLDRILQLAIKSDDLFGCGFLRSIERAFVVEERFVRQRKSLAVALSAQIDDLSPAKQVCAATALGKSRSKRPIDRLVVLARSDDPALSFAAIQALSELKHQDAVPALSQLLTTAVEPRKAVLQQAIKTIRNGPKADDAPPLMAQAPARLWCIPLPGGMAPDPYFAPDIYCSVQSRRTDMTAAAGNGTQGGKLGTRRIASVFSSDDIARAKVLMDDPPPWLAEQILGELFQRPLSPTMRRTLDHYLELTTISMESRLLAADLMVSDNPSREARIDKLMAELRHE